MYLALLFISHFVGDFLLQSDRMALGKSRSFGWLTLHAWIYGACFFWLGLDFMMATFVFHWLTDAVTSRITSRLFFFAPRFIDSDEEWYYVPGRRHWFFVMIGLDQLLHTLQLLGTLWWLQ